MSYEVVIRHLEHRRVRPWRVYLLNAKGRAIQTSNGFDTYDRAERYAQTCRDLFSRRIVPPPS